MAGIRIELQLEDGNFTTRMLHAGESVDEFNRKLGQTATELARAEPHHKSFDRTLRDVLVTVAAARIAFEGMRAVTTGWAGDIIKVNADFEKLQTLLKGMSKAADPTKEAAQQVRDLRDFAKDAPFQLKALTDTFVKLKSTGVDPMAGSLKAVVDSVAAFGGNEEALHRVTIAIQQMSGKGVIQMEELRQQLGEHIPRAVELMARSVGLSTGQLIAQVSKGTLDAKATLEVFTMELANTFGGAAHAQMQTFNGQLSQMNTNFQNLALAAGGTGFFDTVKVQLKDLNTFLSGNAANVLAKDVGNALDSIVRSFREGLDWVIQFRGGIERLGIVLAAGFGAQIVVGGLTSIMSWMRGLVTQTRLLTMEWTAMNNAMAMNSIGIAVGQLGIAGMGISRLTGFARAATIAMTGLSAAMSFAGAVILPVTAILLGAAWAFGAFENAAKDAYDSIVKYGAMDEKQIEVGNQYVETLKKQAQALKEVANAGGAQIATSEFGVIPQSQAEMDAAAEKGARTAQEASDNLERQKRALARRRTQEAVRDELDFIQDLEIIRQKERDRTEIAAQQAYTAQVTELNKNHLDTSKVEAAYQQDKRARDLAFYDAEYADYQNALNNLGNLNNYSQETKSVLEAKYLEKSRELLEKRNRLAEIPLGPQAIGKQDNLQKAIDKAKQMLVKMDADIEGTKAKLEGADGELAKFIATLKDPNNKSFFPRENEQLQLLLDNLIEADTRLRALKQQSAGQEQLSRDLERISQKSKDDLFDSQLPSGKNISEIDKFLGKLSSGAYSGLSAIGKVKADAGAAAKTLVDGFNSALGTETQDKGKDLTTVITSLTTAWASFAQTVNGTSLTPVLQSAADFVKGWATKDKSDPRMMGLTPDQSTVVNSAKEREEQARQNNFATARDTFIENSKAAIVALGESAGEADKKVRALKKDIQDGKFGDNRDVNAPEYAGDIEQAKKEDAAIALQARQAKARSKIESISSGKEAQMDELVEREEDLARRIEAASKNKTPRELFRKTSELNKQNIALQNAVELGILDPEKANAMMAANNAIAQRWNNLEIGDLIQKEQIKNKEIEKGLMTADQAREFSFNQEVQHLQELVDRTSVSADQRAQYEKILADKITLYRKKVLADSPIGKMFKDWSDVSNNLQTSAVGWMNTFSDNLAKMVMKGKIDFKSLADSIIEDLIRIAIRAAISKFVGPIFGLGGVGGIGGGTTMAADGLAAIRHAGGFAGASGPTRRVPTSLFANAQRFHEGGFPGLKSGEVPIIAMKGEQVDWPENLAKQYGGGGGMSQQNNFHVTVNGSAGTAEQNDDLVKKMSMALHEKVNAMVGQGIRQQMRPGGLLRQGG